MFTGIGHEKLNILHRWISWMIVVLSLVHIIPFLYQPLEEGGHSLLDERYYHDPGFGVRVPVILLKRILK
jgi:hypothetical protein